MLNLGPRPTFGDSAVSIEAHLFEAEGDFYDQRVRIDFIGRIRDTMKFEGPEALVAQLQSDAHMARRLLDANA
jgi:riboflavin kinase/FMN adenylyltransferase